MMKSLASSVLLALLILACAPPFTNAFISTPHRAARPQTACHVSLPSSTILSVVETFDGNQIVDPVVVSGVFWSSLKAKFLSFIIGQLLATIAFGVVTTVAASQLSKLGDFISGTLGEAVQDKSSGRAASTGSFKTADQFKNLSPPKSKVSMDLGKLGLCILLDLIGSSSELLPIVGEATDIVWAPIAALLLRNLFYGSNIVLVLEFAEEILPFTDILPLATLCWVVDTFYADTEAARALGLGSYSRVVLDDDTAIDVTSRQEVESKLLSGDKRK